MRDNAPVADAEFRRAGQSAQRRREDARVCLCAAVLFLCLYISCNL